MPNSKLSTDALTPVERKAFDLMKAGEWYAEDILGTLDDGTDPKRLPYSIYRRAYVLDCLQKKGYVEWKVGFSIPGNPHSTFSLYRKPV